MSTVKAKKPDSTFHLFPSDSFLNPVAPTQPSSTVIRQSINPLDCFHYYLYIYTTRDTTSGRTRANSHELDVIHERQRVTFGNLERDQQVERRSRVQARLAPRSSLLGRHRQRVIESSGRIYIIRAFNLEEEPLGDLAPRLSCSAANDT